MFKTKIAFFTDRNGKWELYVMDADSSNQRPMFEMALDSLKFEYGFVAERMVSWRSDGGFDRGCSTEVGGRHMKKTAISIVAQFSLPDTWTPPDRRCANDQAHLPLFRCAS